MPPRQTGQATGDISSANMVATGPHSRRRDLQLGQFRLDIDPFFPSGHEVQKLVAVDLIPQVGAGIAPRLRIVKRSPTT